MNISQQLSDEFTNLIKHLFLRGTSAFLIIFGRRETGKTDLMLLISQILHNEGIISNFATNIKILDSPFQFQKITNLDDLRSWSETIHGKKLFLFDEYGKAFRRRTPMSSLNVKLIDDLQVLRKHKLSTLAATVDEKYIDNTSLGSDILDGIFIKYRYDDPTVARYRDYLQYLRKEIDGIPPTTIKFDTWDTAPFTEHGIAPKPFFKDKEFDDAWRWCHGETCPQLGLGTMQMNRITKKVLKFYMESYGSEDRNVQHVLAEEVGIT